MRWNNNYDRRWRWFEESSFLILRRNGSRNIFSGIKVRAPGLSSINNNLEAINFVIKKEYILREGMLIGQFRNCNLDLLIVGTGFHQLPPLLFSFYNNTRNMYNYLHYCISLNCFKWGSIARKAFQWFFNGIQKLFIAFPGSFTVTALECRFTTN